MTDRYQYWKWRGPDSYYDDDLRLRTFLPAWTRYHAWHGWFWLKHKVLRRPLPPVPKYRGGETTAVTLDGILHAKYVEPILRSADQPHPWMSRLPLKPKDEP